LITWYFSNGLNYLDNSTNAEGFKVMFAYSPYHNAKPGTKYPPTLVTTADHDDRVHPAHSFKYTAAMQHAKPATLQS